MIVIELSLGKEVKEPWIDITIRDLLRGVEKKPEDIFALSRGEAALIVTEAAVKNIELLQTEGKIQGIISYCGGMGSSISSKVMQTLPLGFPKILLSTMLHNAQEYIGSKDIAMMYPVTESGLNSVSRKILNTAAALIAGGAKGYMNYKPDQDKPLVAVSMQGVTTPCSQYIINRLKEDGEADGMIFHANGEGGKAMEDMLGEGYFAAAADVTLGECSAHLLGGVNNAGPGRMSGAALNGIPQVMAPGSVDFSSFRNRGEMGERLNHEIDTGVSGNIAGKMAQIMKEMGTRNRQVISITHLPQIAAMGSYHYKVYKEDNDSGTTSHIVKLSDEERVSEIAHMLSGATLTEAAINNARELLHVESY